MDLLEKYVGPLSHSMRVVEIGCGIGRDAIPLTDRLSNLGSYLGIDVNREQVGWCAANITPRHPNFRFEYFDVREDWYNPAGAAMLSECRIPELAGSVDRIILQSVFTHMLADDIRHYLGEFRRILKPNGRVFATFFIMDDDIFAAQKQDATLFFHDVGDGVYVVDPIHPTMTVAYNHRTICSMMNDAGLKEVMPLVRGSWSGSEPIRAQDIIIMAPVPAD